MIKPNTENMTKGRSASGAATFNCGDTVATTLAGWPLESVRSLAAALEVDVSKYDHLNPGHQRMVIGGRFRKLISDQNKAHASDNSLPTGEHWFVTVADKFRPEIPEPGSEPGEPGDPAKAKKAKAKPAAATAEA